MDVPVTIEIRTEPLAPFTSSNVTKLRTVVRKIITGTTVTSTPQGARIEMTVKGMSSTKSGVISALGSAHREALIVDPTVIEAKAWAS